MGVKQKRRNRTGKRCHKDIRLHIGIRRQSRKLRQSRSKPCTGSKLAAALGNDRGSTTVTAAFMVAAIVALTIVGATSAVGLVHRHQAAVAADMTALAAAFAAERGESPCPEAQEIAGANDAKLRDCQAGVDGTEDVQVVVVKRGKEATARAGPLLE